MCRVLQSEVQRCCVGVEYLRVKVGVWLSEKLRKVDAKADESRVAFCSGRAAHLSEPRACHQ